MAEFKKLSDVEVVAEPTESANVLIEENGVIKKAPVSEVGGGSNFDLDVLITPTLSDGSWIANNEFKTLYTYQEYVDMIHSCKIPKANIVVNFSANTEDGLGYEHVPDPVWQTWSDGSAVTCRGWSWNWCYTIVIYSDGNVEVTISD